MFIYKYTALYERPLASVLLRRVVMKSFPGTDSAQINLTRKYRKAGFRWPYSMRVEGEKSCCRSSLITQASL